MSSSSWIKNISPRQWIHLGILVIAAFIFTRSAVNGELLNYDDERYIQGNELIEGFTGENISKIFTEYFDGHYHPLTLLSLAIDGSTGDNPIKSHHMVNWWLHLLNSILVYVMLGLLFPKKWDIAFGTALLFLLHPMNVESYAWMTERKNVLYSFFFLLSTIKYIQYKDEKKSSDIIITYVFLILSLLSKAQAVILLPVFFLIDVVRGNDLKNKRLWLEKAPALIVFLAFIFVTRDAQVEAWGELTYRHSLADRLFLSTSAFGAYLLKGIIPFQLSPYYPYPSSVGNGLGLWHFLGPIWIAAILAAGVFFWKRRDFANLWGIGFFFFNIILMIKFFNVPFGDYYMADRYNYLPSIGLMWLLVGLIGWIGKRVSLKDDQLIYVVGAYAIILGVRSGSQIETWSNSESLWTAVSSNYPKYAHAKNMLAISQLQSGNTRAAGNSFEELVVLDPSFEGGYENLATLAFQENRKKDALEFVKKALEYRESSASTLKLAVQIGSATNDSDLAIENAQRLVALDPSDEGNQLLFAQVLIKAGQNEKAKKVLVDVNSPQADQLISELLEQEALLDPAKRKARKIMDKAVALGKAGELETSVDLFNQSIELDSSNYKAYVNRASTYAQLKDFESALLDLDRAKELNSKDGMVFYLIAAVNKDLNNKETACQNLKIALELGAQAPQELRNFCL